MGIFNSTQQGEIMQDNSQLENYSQFVQNELKEIKEFIEMKKKDIEKFFKLSQVEMKEVMEEFLRTKFDSVVSGDGYVFAKGKIPVVLVAHLDTVHLNEAGEILEVQGGKERKYLTSKNGIGGDDRCGIIAITQIINKGYSPSVLFVEDEELGCVGSKKFIASDDFNHMLDNHFMIEIDRERAREAVYYHCNNYLFKQWVKEITGFPEVKGRISDIVHLSAASGIASVNIASGYYNPHTPEEYVSLDDLQDCIDAVEKLLKASLIKDKKWDLQPDVIPIETYEKVGFADMLKAVLENGATAIAENGVEVYVDDFKHLCSRQFGVERYYTINSKMLRPTTKWQIKK